MNAFTERNKKSELLKEGILWKWTNYITGWQPRWFRLEGGTLSYYQSQEEVNTCAKGSLQLSFCEMVKHTDPTRFDLVIRGQQYYYLRAVNFHECQLWILAIVRSKTQHQESAKLMTGVVNHDGFVEHPSHLQGPPLDSDLENKRGELRLYRDSLVSQIQTIRSMLKLDEIPDMERINEETGLLVATCDTFLFALDECMHLARANRLIVPMSHLSETGDPSSVGGLLMLDSADQEAAPLTSSSQPPRLLSSIHVPTPPSPPLPAAATTPFTQEKSFPPPSVVSPELEPVPRPIRCRTPSQQRLIRTFFSDMHTSFEDIVIGEDGQIPTLIFLNSCRCFAELFDCFHSTAFAPVKADMVGNVMKVQQKYLMNPDIFPTLQDIVDYEVREKQTNEPQCATNALMWLKRGMSYLMEFLKEILKAGVNPPSDSLVQYLDSAYQRTLRPHHNWVVRGIVALAVRALPYRSTLLKILIVPPTDSTAHSSQLQLLRDIELFTNALNQVIDLINRHFSSRNLPL